MQITVMDINGNRYTVPNVSTYDLMERELIIKDAMERPKAIFERTRIIGFVIER